MSMDRTIEKKKGLKMKHIIWIFGGLVIAFLLYSVIISDHSSVFRTEKEKLTISPVKSDLFNDYITVIGQVEPIYTIYLDVEEGGKVEEIYIKYSDF